MQFQKRVVIGVLVSLAVSAQASIVDVTAADDGDGVVTCVAVWDSMQQALFIDGSHNIWDAGHVHGTVTTDSEEDPILTIINTIDNDTGFVWTGYIVNIYMNKTFSIPWATVYVPEDWTTAITQPQPIGGGQYMGTVTYSAGTPLAPGQTLAFGYQLSFVGSVQFTQEMIPVPEPATLALLAVGGLMIWRGRRAA